MIQKYLIEFTLHVHGMPVEKIKSSLAEFGEHAQVQVSEDAGERGKDLMISIEAEDPTMIFDVCAQFGRIKSAKVNEQGRG